MACAFEALGISPAGSAMVPAEDDDKAHGRRADRRAGDAGARRGPAPEPGDHRATRSRTRSPASAPRAARPTASCTCSRSPARRGSSSTIDDFERISRSTPLLADLKPGGRFVATDLYRAGGVPLILKRLAEAGHPARRRDHGHRPDDRRGGRRQRGDRRARRSCAPLVRPAQERGRARDPARQPRPRGLAWSSSPAPSASARPGPRGCSSPRRTAFAPSRTRRSSPAT